MRPEDATKDIDERFFKEGEAGTAKKGIEGILDDFSKPEKLDKTTKDVIRFLREIWERFSIGKYVDVFVDFARAEKALYGFGERYRDHLMHVFNVHVLGLLIFSKILKCNGNEAFELLKIREEADAIPFPSRYDKPRRLYYLWCLISTFHDIAIPIDRRKELIDGFGKYLDYFKIETEEFYLKFPFMTQSDMERYSDLMSRLFANRMSLSRSLEERTYEIGNCHSASYLYVRSTLAGAMNRYDHGILGAYFLFKSIEEMFLSGKNPNPKYDLDLSSITLRGKPVELPPEKNERNLRLKEFEGFSKEELEKAQRTYDLSREETKKYNNYVFEQDVSRAALGIALHNIDPDKNPKIFPLRFSDFPLTCLLILFDELQEFHRPEGFLLTEVVRCSTFPDVVAEMHSLEGKPIIQISTCLDLQKVPKEIEEHLVDEYNKWVEGKKDEAERKRTVKNYDGLICSTWEHIFETIKKKIAFQVGDQLQVHVSVTLEGKNPCGKPLEYKSLNWRDFGEDHHSSNA
jgi:hypothetical protein